MYRLFTFLLLTLCASGTARDIPLTLDGAASHALRHNPALAAARFRIEEARGRLHQAGRLSNPELELEASRSVRNTSGDFSAMWTQRFPITARLRLEKAVSRAELVAADAELRDAERRLAADTASAAVRLLALRSQQRVREQQISLSRELAEFSRLRAETGETSLVDAAQLDLEAQQLSTELLQLDVERATIVGELRPLLGLGAGDTPVIRGELPPVSRIPAGGATPLARADFQAAQSTAEAARENAALARTSRWEDIGVGLRVAREQEDDPAEGYMRDNFVGLRITIPFPLWNDQTGRIREATAAAARAQKEVEALDVTIRAEAAAARDTMAALARIVGQIDKELLPRAVQVEEQLRAGYSTGQTALLEVLRARDRRLLLQRQRVDALRDYHLARVRHSSATGRLPR